MEINTIAVVLGATGFLVMAGTAKMWISRHGKEKHALARLKLLVEGALIAGTAAGILGSIFGAATPNLALAAVCFLFAAACTFITKSFTGEEQRSDRQQQPPANPGAAWWYWLGLPVMGVMLLLMLGVGVLAGLHHHNLERMLVGTAFGAALGSFVAIVGLFVFTLNGEVEPKFKSLPPEVLRITLAGVFVGSAIAGLCASFGGAVGGSLSGLLAGLAVGFVGGTLASGLSVGIMSVILLAAAAIARSVVKRQ